MGNKMNIKVLLALVIVASSSFFGSQVLGQMALTQGSINAGLTLTTFASNFPSSGSVGPLGILFLLSGGVMVTDYPGNLRILPNDANGQDASAVADARKYGNHDAVGLAQLGSAIYMTDQAVGDLDLINANGSPNRMVNTSLPDVTGITPDPYTWHLYVSQSNFNTIVEIDPTNGSATTFATPTFPDGLYLSPDGNTLYAAANDHILGYNVATKALIFDSGPVGNVDGIVLGSGIEAGNVIGNTNSGQIIAVNLTTSVETVLATGGSRGDFVTIDPTNGSLLVTQSTTILRLTGATSVPEPGSASLVLGMALLVVRRRRIGNAA
jgi:hypothetical protein